MALAQIEHLIAQGAPKHCVLADAGYGVDTALRERLSELGLPYAVGVTGQVTVWPPGREPLPAAVQPVAPSGRRRSSKRLRLGADDLSIAAYGFLMVQQMTHRSAGGKNNSGHRASGEQPTLPTHYKPRGSPAHAAPRAIVHHELAAAYCSSLAAHPTAMPLLPARKRKAAFLTQ